MPKGPKARGVVDAISIARMRRINSTASKMLMDAGSVCATFLDEKVREATFYSRAANSVAGPVTLVGMRHRLQPDRGRPDCVRSAVATSRVHVEENVSVIPAGDRTRCNPKMVTH